MWLPPRWLRRVLLPIYVAFFLTLMAILGVGAVLSAVIAPFGSHSRPLRIAGFGLAYCSMELAVIVASGVLWLRGALTRKSGDRYRERWISWHTHLLTRALRWVVRAGSRCVDFDLIVSDSSKDSSLEASDPVLVLARHGGVGDSFVLVHLLLSKYQRRIRIVLKDVLQFDPALDLLLNRLRCVFLSRNTGEADLRQVASLAEDLGSEDALLIFPEGSNWTPTRRINAIRHLRRRHLTEAVRAATLMENVLPPRPAGVMACLEVRPDLKVVIAAHAGLDRLVTARQVWDALPFQAPMMVRVWPASPLPASPEARSQWLTLEWAVVDEWVDSYHAGSVDQPTG
jgi:1-acyl-sn-glycerol-3-phosphate acyltransferase